MINTHKCPVLYISLLLNKDLFHPLKRSGASQGSYVCASAAAPHQRTPVQHPVHHHHPGHAHGRGLPVLQHQESQPQVSIKHEDGVRGQTKACL